MWLYIWIGVSLFALMVEFATSEVVSVWFVGGGIVAMILTALNVGWYYTLPTFIVVSVVLLFAFRKLVLKKFSKDEIKTNAESVIGKEFILLSPIAFNQMGTIKVSGVVWNAVFEDETQSADAGEKVVVKFIKGNKYIVEKVK